MTNPIDQQLDKRITLIADVAHNDKDCAFMKTKGIADCNCDVNRVLQKEIKTLLHSEYLRGKREGAIEELEKLQLEQSKYIKAQSGHIRNNNSWPKTRGYGIQAQMTLDWIEKRINQLQPPSNSNKSRGEDD